MVVSGIDLSQFSASHKVALLPLITGHVKEE